MEQCLELKNIALTYHTIQAETEALNNVSFSVDKGEFIAIVGPSGCGKSTILSLIAGLLTPSKGEIIKNFSNNQNSIGYMFQKDNLFEWRSIWANVTLGLEIGRKMTEDNKLYAENLLKKYGLWDFKNRYPSQLSGGMRQRAALIRTLTLNPDVLLLDEPFSALDYQTRLNVCDDVYSIIKKEHKTAILVTHDISEAISMADRIIVLTARPAQVKHIFNVGIDTSKTPLKRREDKSFSNLFNTIWKELQTDEKT